MPKTELTIVLGYILLLRVLQGGSSQHANETLSKVDNCSLPLGTTYS
jgi:hypothetical protein